MKVNSQFTKILDTAFTSSDDLLAMINKSVPHIFLDKTGKLIE